MMNQKGFLLYELLIALAITLVFISTISFKMYDMYHQIGLLRTKMSTLYQLSDMCERCIAGDLPPDGVMTNRRRVEAINRDILTLSLHKSTMEFLV